MDNTLLQQVYQKYSKEIYAYLYTLCKNHSLTEDLLQETFLKAILSLPNTHKNVRAWLYMVARNLYFNYAKRAAKEAEDSLNTIEENSPPPEQAVISKLMNRDLYKALLELSCLKREVIMMQYFSEIPLREIALILQISPENVRVISYRAKKDLKKLMEEHGYDIS